MNRVFAWLLFLCVALSLGSPAWPQSGTLTPPDNHYFVSRGTWGQTYPDQWAFAARRFRFLAELGMAPRQA
jgi:hypothetical protein